MINQQLSLEVRNGPTALRTSQLLAEINLYLSLFILLRPWSLNGIALWFRGFFTLSLFSLFHLSTQTNQEET